MQLHPQYYYQQLPPPERTAYHGMLTCLQELAPSARIPRLSMETLGTIFFQLRLDHPEIFYGLTKSASASTVRRSRHARRGCCARCAA